MTISVEKLPDCKAKLSVEIPSGEVNPERDKIVSLYARQAKIPGFRPGKAPRSAVEKRYPQEIEGELRDRLVSQVIRRAGSDEKLEILGVAQMEHAIFGPDGSFALSVTVVTAPEFSIPDYSTIPVEVPRIGVEDAQVDAVLERMRQNFSELADIEGPLKRGDIAVLAWKTTLEGQPLAEAVEEDLRALAESEEYWMAIPEEGSDGHFLPGFADQLIGLSKGDSRDINITLGEDFEPESLRGKELVFAVTVKETKERKLAPLDDTLANRVSEGKTLEEVREQIRAGLMAEHERMRANLVTNQVLAHLGERLEFELPQHLLFNETQRQVNDMVYESYQRGATEDLIREHQGEILENAQSRAKINLKTTFILEKIAEAEGIAATDEEVSRQIVMLSMQSQKPVKKVMRQLRENNGFARIRHDVTISKTLDFLRSKAVITEVDPPAPEVTPEEGEN
ncbi:MAG: trigger factor [Verrucomicrobiales bacterium]|nr:trigger factor [Verrucomicrobiales bacterium]